VVLPLVTHDVVLAVKNGPAGMWRAWSSPAHLSPHSTWLLLALTAAVTFVVWALSRALRRGAHRTGGPAAQVIDLAGRRRSAKTRRGSESDRARPSETPHGRARTGKGVH
jgi:hypothetical protein